MATIYDVARAAGVSAATVSHVVNGSRVVAPATAQKVRQAIESLHYRQNAVARSLRRSRTGTIGLIISDIANPFFAEMVRGVEDAVYGLEDGSNLILCNTDEDTAKERLYLDVLLEKRVDGLILAPAGGNAKVLRGLAAAGFPVVMADRDLPGVEADSVTVDNRDATLALINHLARLGHRRIAAVRASLMANSIDARIEGYRLGLEAAGIPFDPGLIVHSASDIDQAFEACVGLLQSGRSFSAVFCTNNFMTLGMIRALAEQHLHCPQDVAVVGFDDFPWSEAFRPRLTVIAQPGYAIGAEAVALLAARLAAGAKAPPKRLVLNAKLLIRESCGAALAPADRRLLIETHARQAEAAVAGPRT